MDAFKLNYSGAEINGLLGRIDNIFNLIYPVGAIYMSTSNVSPATLFGGTWAAIEGKFLVGADSTFTAGETGGTSTHTHGYAHTHTTPATTTGSHTLVESEIPSHRHSSVTRHAGTDDNNFSGHVANAVASNDTTPAQEQLYTGYTGGGGGHTHGQVATTTNSQSTSTTDSSSSLPPYLSVYIWKRTA